MSVVISNIGRGGVLSIDIVGAVSAANAGVGQLLNPEGIDLLILRTTFLVKTKSTGAATLGIGVTTVGASATDILNALDVNGATNGNYYNGHVMQNGAKTQATAPAKWTAATFITFTGSADTTGLTGTLYIEYIRV